jgi:hypothetical protein
VCNCEHERCRRTPGRPGRPRIHRHEQRYGIDAVVHEFNCNWIAGLGVQPLGRNWIEYGEKLAEVFDEYFTTVGAAR